MRRYMLLLGPMSLIIFAVFFAVAATAGQKELAIVILGIGAVVAILTAHEFARLSKKS